MKRSTRLLIAALVIAALVVALVLIRNRPGELPEADGTNADADRVTILDVPRESITSIAVDRPDGSLNLRAGPDGVLTPVYRYDVTFDDSKIGRIVGSVASLMSQRVIEAAPGDVGQYGLTAPSARVVASVAGGDPVSILVGSRTPSGGAYYVQRIGDPAVYAVSAAWVSPFFYSLDDLRDKTLPVIDLQKLETVQIHTLAGRTIEVEPLPADNDDPGLSLTAMIVTKPYTRPQQVSTTWLDGLADILPAIEVVRFVDDNPQDLSSYGLEPPRASFRIADDASVLDLQIGDPITDGRYARRSDGGPVFVVSGTESLVDLTPYTTITPFIFIVDIDLVDSVTVESADATYVASITRTPAENPDDDPIETFFLNGTEVEDGLFRDLYQWLIGLQADADNEDPVPGTPDVTITYRLNDGSEDVRIEFVPHDANYYAVYRDARSEFLITRNKVRRMLAALADPQTL